MNRYMRNKTVTDTQGLANKLPDDIIRRILKCLPLHDAAKLCLVSRSWLCAFEELSELRFDAKVFAAVLKSKPPTAEELFNILSVILLSHIGTISVFYVCIPKLKSSSAPDIGPCFSYLSRNGVKDITIKNVENSPLKLSYHLFSCLNLERLTLDNCIINLLPFFKQFVNLKTIEFENVTFKGNSLTDFIASCPALQTLTLTRCKGFEYMEIIAPNLKYLTVLGNFESVCFRNAATLIGFSVTLEETVANHQSAGACELLAYLARPCKIENLSFGGHFCKFLTAGRIGRMFPTKYSCLKSLQLSNIETHVLDEFLWVIGLIKSCPVVEDLKISFSGKECEEHAIAFDSHYRLCGLRKVQLTSVSGVIMELKLIEYLLRCSPALETMSVKRDAKITKVLETRLARELMYFCRASPVAKIVYEDP
ncbi:F-box/FBD/LRR-repeat protein At1g13570-like [Silene latifolia]|uniref:F-box/FBD/LRR-repeat protein At1g13570-like n=1 Tax=Silene latifolia TaxID=37657 RepID=UPI003D780C0F